ncbi:MAG TPA: Rne/Rng family ribonuclease [Mycobacteriales bacterium]|nr:Rne/Rng family ribonuclease [Mycobacteriales bacterium]
MLDDDNTTDPTDPAAGTAAPKRRAARRPAGPPSPASDTASAAGAGPAEKSASASTDGTPAPVKRTRKKAAAAAPSAPADGTGAETASGDDTPAPARRRRAPAAAAKEDTSTAPAVAAPISPTAVLFQPPPAAPAPARRAPARVADDADAAAPPRRAPARASSNDNGASDEPGGAPEADSDSDGELDADGMPRSNRRRRGRRGRGGRGTGEGSAAAEGDDEQGSDSSSNAGDDGDDDAGPDDGTGTGTHRRRRRRRTGGGEGSDPESPDDPPNTVVHVRTPRQIADDSARGDGGRGDGVRGVKGSTRIEAKRQRRRDGRETQRRRPSIITEAEFLARREAVERVMVVRQAEDRTQIAVLEDNVLVEHYVTRKHATSMVGNVYLGKVQNVLPSMEAAFVDIGRGRNAVLYAGEVNYDASALEGGPPRIEQALKSGQTVLVQVTKDPIGQKGARLTSQVSLPGRFMVYVPDGRLSGISRKLPDTERTRLKHILKKVMPENAGVIVRTAAEGAAEAELDRDVTRLAAQWESIEKKAKTASAPSLLYGEPDLTVRVVRDVFNEDFSRLIVSGDEGWETIDEYVHYVAPHLADRLSRWGEDDGSGSDSGSAAESGEDAFATYRIDEQLAKALERKVWLPSGGSLVIDRTEAMTVIDVNTGKFTGQGGNLEETVTRNNLEAAEEIVRQLRLRDVGGIVVIDFIDMVLESNRELVLRRLLECLARDRTKHQVAEVTSLGLVQMTRKRVGAGLLEAFSQPCECCNGRGVILTLEQGEPTHRSSAGHSGSSGSSNGQPSGNSRRGGRPDGDADDEQRSGRGSRRGKRSGGGSGVATAAASAAKVAAASTVTVEDEAESSSLTSWPESDSGAAVSADLGPSAVREPVASDAAGPDSSSLAAAEAESGQEQSGKAQKAPRKRTRTGSAGVAVARSVTVADEEADGDHTTGVLTPAPVAEAPVAVHVPDTAVASETPPRRRTKTRAGSAVARAAVVTTPEPAEPVAAAEAALVEETAPTEELGPAADAVSAEEAAPEASTEVADPAPAETSAEPEAEAPVFDAPAPAAEVPAEPSATAEIPAAAEPETAAPSETAQPETVQPETVQGSAAETSVADAPVTDVPAAAVPAATAVPADPAAEEPVAQESAMEEAAAEAEPAPAAYGAASAEPASEETASEEPRDEDQPGAEGPWGLF